MGLFCKKEYPYYRHNALCKNCYPTTNKSYYGIEVKIPKGTSIDEFFKDKERTCPNCGLKDTLIDMKKTEEANSST